jgi:hypothetical protein
LRVSSTSTKMPSALLMSLFHIASRMSRSIRHVVL